MKVIIQSIILAHFFLFFVESECGPLNVGGAMLSWVDLKRRGVLEDIKTQGVDQFIALYYTYKGVHHSPFLCGDEIEYFVCDLGNGSQQRDRSSVEKKAKLVLRAPQLLKNLNADPLSRGFPLQDQGMTNQVCEKIGWHPEYASWMIESTPARPYNGTPMGLLKVEESMLLRRKIIKRNLNPWEQVFTLSVFPRMGCPDFTSPRISPDPEHSVFKSLYMPDEVVEAHPRFETATRSIMQRRNGKVEIEVPSAEGKGQGTGICMDATAFGMGAGCLQVTMQAPDMTQARYLYDMMAVLAPLMLAITAGSPIWKGELVGVDARWGVLEQAGDDRTAGERGQGGLEPGEQRVYKSRYSAVDCYIADSGWNREEFNNMPVPINQHAFQQLISAGIDKVLARHIAHLFVRDPLVVQEESLQAGRGADLWEAVQSTNWNSVRFKPPPPGEQNSANIGWRVELRTMELGISDKENAAITVFVALLAQALLHDPCDLYLPVSLLEDNLQRAQAPRAVETRRFHFRGLDNGGGETLELSLQDIFLGKDSQSAGLLHLVRRYLDKVMDPASEDARTTRAKLEGYLQLVEGKVCGSVPTTATWIREFMARHPQYRDEQPPRVTEEMCHDMLQACEDVQSGAHPGPAWQQVEASLAHGPRLQVQVHAASGLPPSVSPRCPEASFSTPLHHRAPLSPPPPLSVSHCELANMDCRRPPPLPPAQQLGVLSCHVHGHVLGGHVHGHVLNAHVLGGHEQVFAHGHVTQRASQPEKLLCSCTRAVLQRSLALPLPSPLPKLPLLYPQSLPSSLRPSRNSRALS